MKGSGLTLWFTGLSGAGKTTISQAVALELRRLNLKVEILDGDIIRTYLSKKLGFSKEDREENIRRIGFVASLLSRNDVIAIVAAISPYRSTREEARQLSKNFVEVYVKASLAICEERDVKGLYAMARAGKIQNFTGISDPYEPPIDPEITCNTEQESVNDSVDKVIFYLTKEGYL